MLEPISPGPPGHEHHVPPLVLHARGGVAVGHSGSDDQDLHDAPWRGPMTAS